MSVAACWELRLHAHGSTSAEFDAVHTVERARDVGSLEAIVPPAAMRPQLIRALRAPGG